MLTANLKPSREARNVHLHPAMFISLPFSNTTGPVGLIYVHWKIQRKQKYTMKLRSFVFFVFNMKSEPPLEENGRNQLMHGTNENVIGEQTQY